jgi:hypothetical protein
VPFTESHISGPTREAAFAVLGGIEDKETLKPLHSNTDLIRLTRSYLKQRDLEIYALPQAALMGRPLAGGAARLATLPVCTGAIGASPALSDGSLRLRGAIARPWAWRGAFTDSIAVVTAAGDTIGVGGFVSVAPRDSVKDGQVYGIADTHPWLRWAHRLLPRILNQDMAFVAFVPKAHAAGDAALVYLRAGEPDCILR